MQIAFEMTAPF